MKFEGVYRAVLNAVLSTAIYRDFADKDACKGELGLPWVAYRITRRGTQRLRSFQSQSGSCSTNV
jgi:hypothetical protein